MQCVDWVRPAVMFTVTYIGKLSWRVSQQKKQFELVKDPTGISVEVIYSYSILDNIPVIQWLVLEVTGSENTVSN